MVCDLSATTKRIAVGNKFPLIESALQILGRRMNLPRGPGRSIDYVRFWHKADITAEMIHVRFRVKRTTVTGFAMSASDPKRTLATNFCCDAQHSLLRLSARQIARVIKKS